MKSKRMFFVIVAVLLLSIFGGGVIYYFADQYLSKKAQDISQLKAELDVIQLKIDGAIQAEKDLEELNFIKEIANQVLPPEKIQSNIVGDLVKFGEDTGVTVRGISFTPTSSTGEQLNLSQTKPLDGVPGVNALPMTLSVNGRYEEILNFLRKLETNRRKMQVDNLMLTPQPDGGDITATLIINVYVRA
jgi:Tfp pilus assembly protein PilO